MLLSAYVGTSWAGLSILRNELLTSVFGETHLESSVGPRQSPGNAEWAVTRICRCCGLDHALRKPNSCPRSQPTRTQLPSRCGKLSSPSSALAPVDWPKHLLSPSEWGCLLTPCLEIGPVSHELFSGGGASLFHDCSASLHRGF